MRTTTKKRLDEFRRWVSYNNNFSPCVYYIWTDFVPSAPFYQNDDDKIFFLSLLLEKGKVMSKIVIKSTGCEKGLSSIYCLDHRSSKVHGTVDNLRPK